MSSLETQGDKALSCPLNEQMQASVNFEAVLYLGYLCYCSHSYSNIND